MSATISLNRILNASESNGTSSFAALSTGAKMDSSIIIGNANEAFARPNFPNLINCSCSTLNGNNFSAFEPSLKSFQ